MKAVLMEDENGQIVAYTRRGTYSDMDQALQALNDIDKITKDGCIKVTEFKHITQE